MKKMFLAILSVACGTAAHANQDFEYRAPDGLMLAMEFNASGTALVVKNGSTKPFSLDPKELSITTSEGTVSPCTVHHLSLGGLGSPGVSVNVKPGETAGFLLSSCAPRVAPLVPSGLVTSVAVKGTQVFSAPQQAGVRGAHSSAAPSEDLWFLLSGTNECTPAYRAAAELGMQAPHSVTPHQFAAILERSSGMQSSITYGGDSAPAMIFMRRSGNRGMADNTFTLVKSRQACTELAARLNDKQSKASAVANTPAPTPTQSAGTPRASFDCTKANSASEKLICSDGELAALDVKLSGVFAAALKNSSDPAALRRASVAAWKQRESQCADKQCLLDWFKERLARLQ